MRSPRSLTSVGSRCHVKRIAGRLWMSQPACFCGTGDVSHEPLSDAFDGASCSSQRATSRRINVS